jgi:hypothetical protein
MLHYKHLLTNNFYLFYRIVVEVSSIMSSTYQQHVDRRIREMRQRLIHFQKRKKQERSKQN